MHKCLSGTGSSIQKSSFSRAVGKWSSAYSSYSSSSSSSALVRWWAIGCSSGEWCSIQASSEESLSSSNVKWWHTVVRLPGCGGECGLGVAGLKDKFSHVETWYRCGALCRGVGILKLSLPLSYPPSSKASSHLKASFEVVLK